ncbi:Equilibrative nucleoside transporter, partial [Globisporangium splendens]
MNALVRAARLGGRHAAVLPRSSTAAPRSRGSNALLSRRLASSKTTPEPSSEGVHVPREKVTKEMLISEFKEILKLVVGGTVAIVGLVTTSGYVIEKTKQWNPMPASGMLLEIPGDDGNTVTVHVQKKGTGPLTVVLDGGVGETSFDWEKVMEQIANEYAQVLQKLNVLDQVILVGHGAGGYNMRQFAEDIENPNLPVNYTVEGLVLVDALQENLREELERVSPTVKSALKTMDDNGETVLALSRFGIIRMINSIQRDKFVKRYSPIALPFVEHFLPSPAHRQGALWENQGIPLTEERLRNEPRASGFEFPCVVLSHGKPDMFDGMKADANIDLDTIVALERKWQAAQQRLVDEVSALPSVHIVVPDVGHNIQHEEPDEITRVVRALVNEAQDKGSGEGLKSL